MTRLDRIEKGIEALQKSQLETERLFALTEIQLAKTDEQLAKTDAQLARTDAKLAAFIDRQELGEKQLAETKRIVSGIGINLGDAAEDFFENSLQENLVLGDIHFDSIAFRLQSRKGKIQDEFDIVMYNGDSVAIIEVKHKVHPADIEVLIQKKLPNFRALFPRFSDLKCYLGVAGMSVPGMVIEKAEEAGIAVLRQKGKVLVMNKRLKAF